MSSEAAAYQAAQQRHKHNMAFGKKQRYIEVFQCSGEDMNHVLTPGTNAAATAAALLSSTSSPVKTTTTNTNAAAAQAQAAAVAAAANGLLPSGMLTPGAASAAPQNTTIGLDPNWAAAAAMQMQMSPNLAFLPNSAATHQPHYFPANAVRFPAAAAQAAFYNPAMQQAVALQQLQQQQLLQHQLLQSQLAAQRLLLSSGNPSTGTAAVNGAPGLIGPRPPPQPKRSFDQAFATNSAADSEAKRLSYGTPTISAAPTTYNSR